MPFQQLFSVFLFQRSATIVCSGRNIGVPSSESMKYEELY